MNMILQALSLVATLLISSPTMAHEGHAHEAEPPVDVRIAPRFEASTAAFELVGVVTGRDWLIYLDRKADNAPISGAKIEVEGPDGFKATAAAAGEGVYRLAGPAVKAPSTLALTFTIEAGELLDLIPASLVIAPLSPSSTLTAAGNTWFWWAGGFVLLGVAGAWLRLRYRRRGLLLWADKARNI